MDFKDKFEYGFAVQNNVCLQLTNIYIYLIGN